MKGGKHATKEGKGVRDTRELTAASAHHVFFPFHSVLPLTERKGWCKESEIADGNLLTQLFRAL